MSGKQFQMLRKIMSVTLFYLFNLLFSVLVSILVNNLSKRSSTDRVIDQTKWKDFPSEPEGQKLVWIIYFFHQI